MNKKILTVLGLIIIGLTFISAVTITDVKNSPKEVAPGEIINIAFEVENIFNYDVENLNIKLDLSNNNIPFAPYQSSSEKFLDELGEGDKEDFKFNLITLPETDTGIYKIPIEISYTYEEGNNTLTDKKSELISITVNSKPKLKVSLDDSVVLIKGKENKITLKIINSGLSNIKFLYVEVGNANGLKFLNEKEEYVGDLDSDDFDNVEYTVLIENSAAKSINLPITLKYMDSTNKEFNETTNLILTTYSLKDAKKIGLLEKTKITPYLIIIVLSFFYFLYRIRKKRKLKKKRN